MLVVSLVCVFLFRMVSLVLVMICVFVGSFSWWVIVWVVIGWLLVISIMLCLVFSKVLINGCEEDWVVFVNLI